MAQTESYNYAAMGGISATALKIIGMIAMTIDHIGYFLFPQIEAFLASSGVSHIRYLLI